MLPRRALRPARLATAHRGTPKNFHDYRFGKPSLLEPLIAADGLAILVRFLRAGFRGAEEGCRCRLCQFYLLGEQQGFLNGDPRRAGT